VSRLLLDTDALLWWLTDDPALSVPARDALADPANEPLVSRPLVHSG
jgi:PIN domain nuclease of toxin-antitoxin system